MVEVVGQTVLLALMGRLRRRRRWIAALEAGGVACAIASTALALGVVFVRATGGGRPVGFTTVAVPLGLAVAIGGAVGGLRHVTLAACARAVDRVWAQGDVPASSGRGRDDCVLAAVTLTADAVTATPFVVALVDVAIRRVRRVPPERAIPAPRWRWMALAPIATTALALFAPPRWLVWGHAGIAAGATVARQQMSEPGGGTGDRANETRVAISAVALEVERDEAAAALKAASATGDPFLAAGAREFERLLALLSGGGGMNASAAVALLERLDRDAGGAARAALDAAAAGAAAEAALRAVKQNGPAGAASKDLAAATAASTDAAGAGAEARATAAAARLAAAGEVGRGALGAAAGAGARSLEAASPASGSDADTGRAQTAPANGPAAAAVREPRRYLEQLRRDLDEGQRGCQGDAEACRGTAENSGRALSRLQREGRTAETRQRFAEATRQLLERISREEADGGAGQDPRRLRRFGQAARGQWPGGDPKDESGRQQGPGPESGTAGEQRAGTASGDGVGDPAMSAGPAAPRGGDSSSGGGDEGARAAAHEPSTRGGDTAAHGDSGAAVPRSANSREHASGQSGAEAAAGGGVGNVAGGPVLGARGRNLGGGRPGHDAAVTLLPGQGPGASRAQIINGAAARGFASADYRRVFSDYRAAVEESMEAADVPAGKRFLVRRYFQLIRPRSNP
ncbi:MAG: hypothetical protein ABIS92_07000 [Polyangia bacterium]